VDEIENRLRRYRPVGPPAELRSRIVEAARESGSGARAAQPSVLPRIATWFPAAAAVILIMLFSWMSSIERGRIEARVPGPTDDNAPAFPTETWP
jgi:hypothetical protein